MFDELQLGTDFVSRQFVYHAGKVTAEHKEKAKVKSSATTQLVSQIILSNGTTLSYGYDAEERITSVVETYTVDETPVTNTTLYTYDALGQLLTETVNGEVVNTMKYDNYGNIVEKNGKAYTYGNATWKDLLTGFDGKAIEYDAQGNPVKYLGHTLTWEKGRQLKSFDNIEYTYNANGIRTSKKVNGVLHTYTLDGTKILRETWDGNTLVPLYDNEDGVCGILYNNIPYYFIKNLQGDVIAIVDKDAQTVARYSYDAWGAVTNAVTYTELTDGVDIATINPFRYRGYYYDEEIGLYYLQSRYYDPNCGRFVNGDTNEIILVADDAVTTNYFTYCENNIVGSIDPSGMISLNSVKNKILEFINKIKNKLQKITENLRIQYSSNYVSLPTPPIAIAIDAVIFAISKISHFAIKTLLKAFIAWAKSNKKSFAKFVRQYLIENCRKILLSLISFLARKFSKKYALEKLKNRISNAIFGDSLLFRIYSAFSSIGNIIATILDIMDGYWDDKMRIKI